MCVSNTKVREKLKILQHSKFFTHLHLNEQLTKNLYFQLLQQQNKWRTRIKEHSPRMNTMFTNYNTIFKKNKQEEINTF